MPFLPMKYPEYRLSMEAALPSSIHSWLRQELEQRGIDSLVYTRYIISLLLQDDEDLEGLDKDIDVLSAKRKGRGGSDKQKSRRSVSEEDRKKYAAIQCLSAITDEKSGIETLVDELCSRLKDTEINAHVSPIVKSRSCSSDGSDDSCAENQNPAQRYYAAFPALHGHGASTNPSPSETIWRNNPLVNKSLASLTSEDDSSSANEDAEIRKINIPCPVVIPKHRKPRKNNSKNRRDHQGTGRGRHDGSRGNQKGVKQSQKEQGKPTAEFPTWPPGFAKLDPIILHNLDILDEDQIFVLDSPKRPNDELCTRVESLLKGMLLPVPEKTYKNLQDVDDILPEELREKFQRKSNLPSSSESEDANQQVADDSSGKMALILDKSDPCSPVHSLHEESVSPELKEQESWYTQPIDVIFQSQDDEVSNSKLRLYKRNSYPEFSPESVLRETGGKDCIQSSASSPVFERNRSLSFASDNSDDIFEGSVLIPAWLTDVLSADEHSDENFDEIDLSASLKSSSPLLSNTRVKADCQVFPMPDENIDTIESLWSTDKLSICSGQSISVEEKNKHPDDNCTPTPDDVFNHAEEAGNLIVGSCSVSLVDLDYMSRFVGGSTPEWHSLSPDEGLTIASPRRPGISTLWQSQVLFDYTLHMADSLTDLLKPVIGVCDIHCWQPIGFSPYSQLWDVNMQKRSKVSPWGGSLLHTDDQVWFAENTLVFMNLSEVDDDQCDNDHSENTLIPRISIDVNPDMGTGDSVFLERDDDVDYGLGSQFFDRSVSMGDVPSLWDDDVRKKLDPKLSKSFELVPSEHSAFYDVPRKLLHVHSEPNLVQFRQELGDNNPETTASPQEHLYFSPKTHFRPITPASAPELCASKAKQQVCNDLFGGLPSTKTPYQQYHSIECGNEEKSFIPSFKVKNYSKSIQTGDSFDKVESPVVSDESVERDTPETLTLSVIENVMGEKDDIDRLLMITEDLDTANTDSAYETDYSTNQGGENETDRGSQATGGKGCVMNGSMFRSQGFFDCDSMDHGNLGERADYSVESFLATFPHKQDWPDGPCQLIPPSDNAWKDQPGEPADFPTDSWCQFEQACEEITVQPAQFPVGGVWGEDLAIDHLYGENEMDKYKHIWSTAGQDYYSVDIGVPGEMSTEKCYDCVEETYDNLPSEDILLYSNMYYKQINEPSEICDNVDVIEEDRTFPSKDIETGQSVDQPGSGKQEIELCGYAGFPDSGDVIDSELVHGIEPSDYYNVKLVYKDKHVADDHLNTGQSYGSYDLMPMPDEGVMSTELEKEWFDKGLHALWGACKPSSAQRKPCSFYLEGNCRRSDCKFAHDISNITCRFWEEGGCFKGPLCPFLHGYPRECSPGVKEPDDTHLQDEKDKFDLNTDEFPELSLAVKNGNNNNSHKKSKLAIKCQNLSTTNNNKREKVRRGNARRHSNKENRCEVKIVNKCSSSI